MSRRSLARNKSLRRTTRQAWSTAFIAALGLTPFACGTDEVTSTTSPFPCENPVATVVAGIDTGFDRCDGDVVRRRAIVDCPINLPRTADICDDGGVGECSSDADCTASANGYCTFVGGPGAYCGCQYGCSADSDCADGQICECGDPVGRCVTASCTSDDDCAGELLCTKYDTQPSCGPHAYACQTARDTCGSVNQCTVVDGVRQDPGSACAIGRPFLVEGEERLAEPTDRADWCAAIDAPRVAGLSPETRLALRDHWTMIGLMEHASVAAFARFALQLLQLGAPPELVFDTQAAMADETEHAKLCFALASAYAERPIGPGPLEMDGAFDHVTLRDILAMLIREGCIGETVAALEAVECLEHVEDPVVERVLSKIADDERRHALLAWETVRWALGQGDDELSTWLVAEFERAFAELSLSSAAIPIEEAARLRHGVYGDTMRTRLRRDVIVDIIAPTLRAMLREDIQRAA